MSDERQRPLVTVVGLGPAGPDLLTEAARQAIDRIPVRFLRTDRHPSACAVPDPTTFDHLYESADRFDQVYVAIADELVAAAVAHREVLYAVPGSPLVLERSVQHLRDDERIDVSIVASLSFLDLAYERLGIDPVDVGLHLVDGHDFATAAAGLHGPMLVAHCHDRWVLSAIKLAAEDASGDEEVVILQRLGGADEFIVRTTWADLDRTVEPDHLTSIYIPRLGAPVGREYVRFHELTRTLRERCPWDREQTHQSLIPYLVEETYEVVDALSAPDQVDSHDADGDEHLIEELGDLLYQIEFHSAIAEEEGRFTMADVVRGIHDKLVRRHPHVFADLEGRADAVDEPSDHLTTQWEAIKQAEKQRSSPFDGIPRSLPSLAYAAKVLKRAARAHTGDRLDTELDDELAQTLVNAVVLAGHSGRDAELVLRAAIDELVARWESDTSG